jgi:hypothetical protein
LAEDALGLHLVILFLLNFEEELKVILHEVVGEMMRLFLCFFHANFIGSFYVVLQFPCGDFVDNPCIVLQLPAWRNLLLHHVASIAIVGVV